MRRRDTNPTLAGTRLGREPIPPAVDAHLHRIAESCAGTDYRLHLIGWSRFEYIDAIHRRLREKWINEQDRETA